MPRGEAIDGALPRMPAVKAHFRALPYSQIPEALGIVETSSASQVAKLALRFLIFTAARSGEVRGATWTEIHGDVWKIPGERMKAGAEHRVPTKRANAGRAGTGPGRSTTAAHWFFRLP